MNRISRSDCLLNWPWGSALDTVGTARYVVWTPQRGVPTMELQTPRLILRSFREEDVDAMADLFANPDFMRFSLGAFTERKQTVAFIE
jgi:hypothetical protein